MMMPLVRTAYDTTKFDAILHYPLALQSYQSYALHFMVNLSFACFFWQITFLWFHDISVVNKLKIIYVKNHETWFINAWILFWLWLIQMCFKSTGYWKISKGLSYKTCIFTAIQTSAPKGIVLIRRISIHVTQMYRKRNH